jgi:hypothetical protein
MQKAKKELDDRGPHRRIKQLTEIVIGFKITIGSYKFLSIHKGLEV